MTGSHRSPAMKCWRSLLVVATLAVASPAVAQVTATTLYFVAWDTEYRVDMTPERLRQHPDVRVDIFQPEARTALLNLLEPDPNDFSSADEPLRDVRLVVDMTMSDGKVRTFLGNRFGVADPQNGAVRRVDGDFRRRLGEVLFGCRTCR